MVGVGFGTACIEGFFLPRYMNFLNSSKVFIQLLSRRLNPRGVTPKILAISIMSSPVYPPAESCFYLRCFNTNSREIMQ